jgi:hypothetical protein
LGGFPAGTIQADKAYDADEMLENFKEARGKAVIPLKKQ